MLLILALTFVSVEVQALHHDIPPCRNVTWECNANVTCNSSYNQLSVDCAGAFNSGNCSSSCRSTFVNLLRDPIGQRYNNCACDSSDQPCLSFEQLCLANVPSSNNCSVLTVACDNNAFCGPLQMDYDRDCNAIVLDKAKDCTEDCLQSYNRLILNPIGKARAMCSCPATGNDAVACAQTKTTVGLYCLGSTKKPPVLTGGVHTATPPTASPTIPPDNCLRRLDGCTMSSSCKAVLDRVMNNCSSANRSSCGEDCKTSFGGFLRMTFGKQLALCSCRPNMDQYSECKEFKAIFPDIAMYCNIPLPTHPPPPTTAKPTSGALGLTTKVMLLFAAMAVQLLG